jgi:hypothetical protein
VFKVKIVRALLKGIVSKDLMRIRRPADGFIGKKILDITGEGSFLTLVIFKLLNLYAQPASPVGDHASGRRTCWGAISLAGRGGLQELLIGKPLPESTAPVEHRGPQKLLIGMYVPCRGAIV